MNADEQIRRPDTAPVSEAPGAEPIPGADVDPIAQFAHLVPALWRTMRRAARAEGSLPANESQVTILRLLLLHGDLSPAQLADLLRIARPTVSNLLRDLVASGLVERRIAEHDARSMVISVTSAGRDVLETFREERVALLGSALGRMSDEDQTRLTAAMPALRSLLRQLERVADEAAEPERGTA